MAQPDEVIFLSDFQRTIVAKETISPAVETISRETVEAMMAGFPMAPLSTLLAAGTKNDDRDPKIEDTLIEEDIAEPELSD
jgi:hypothetical protein